MADVLSMDGFAAARAFGLDRQRSQRVAAQVDTEEDLDEAITVICSELVAAATDEQEVERHG